MRVLHSALTSNKTYIVLDLFNLTKQVRYGNFRAIISFVEDWTFSTKLWTAERPRTILLIAIRIEVKDRN